ncbi:MAG TPA: homoserine dehydrogenase [Cryomorphaceae bacterium]|nr:homoserine dehydrogenase [Cryomorphaceae bacterium]
MKQKVGIIGRGVVGRALIEQVRRLSEFEIIGVAIKNASKHRDLPRNFRVNGPFDLIEKEEVGIILEAINHSSDSLAYALNTLEQGKIYITASKKMVAENLTVLQRAEEKGGGKLFYEAAVGGAIPIIRTLKEHFRAEPVTEVRGILNGSCNYILSRMYQAEVDFDQALKEAQKKGFAETDPTTDVEGHDTLHKAILIAYTLNGSKPEFSRIKLEGIRSVTLDDIRDAKKLKNKIKLVASVKESDGKFSIDIRPTLVSAKDDLYAIDLEMNAAVISGLYSGSVLLKGAGAGGNPTASAMVGDLLNARNRDSELIQRLLKAI